MDIFTIQADIKSRLSKHYQDTILADQYTRWMLEAIMDKSYPQIMAQNFLLSHDHHRQISLWLAQLIEHDQPIQYLIGSVSFGPLTINVEHPVLIPRPETEVWAYDFFSSIAKVAPSQRLRILDLYTGSGCIGLLAAHLLPAATVIGVDNAEHAIALAGKNKKNLNIGNITFEQADALFYHEQLAIPFDIVVANPPYIDHDDWLTLSPSVTAWEDYNALVADDNGYACIAHLIHQSDKLVGYNQLFIDNKLPQLIIEIGHQQGADGLELLKAQKYLGFHHIIKDYRSKDRVLAATVAGE